MDSPTPPATVAPEVQDKRLPPAGLMPKNMQSLMLCALAAVMVIVIWFSGRTAPKAPGAPPSARSATLVLDPDAERIKDYQRRIDEQARKLQQEQARLGQTEERLAAPDAGAGRGVGPVYPRSAALAGGNGAAYATASDSQRESPARREEQALRASNVALSFRTTAAGTTRGQPRALAEEPRAELPAESVARALALYGAPKPARDPADEEPSGGSSSAIRNESPGENPRSDGEASAGEGAPTNGRGAGRLARDADNASRHLEGKKYRLFEGTLLETVLTNRLDGSFSGPVNCMVTTNLYSHNGQHLLVPQGTRVLGEVRRVTTFGENRLAVFFHRLVMPSGYSVSLDTFQGLNQIGETGLRDQINRHYLQVFGASIAIGAIAGLSQANTQYGVTTSAEDAYRQGVASSLSQSSLRILDRYLNVLPTITIREGHRVKVYLSDDLLLPAYDTHSIPTDF